MCISIYSVFCIESKNEEMKIFQQNVVVCDKSGAVRLGSRILLPFYILCEI